jgi:hypothetical protein
MEYLLEKFPETLPMVTDGIPPAMYFYCLKKWKKSRSLEDGTRKGQCIGNRRDSSVQRKA